MGARADEHESGRESAGAAAESAGAEVVDATIAEDGAKVQLHFAISDCEVAADAAPFLDALLVLDSLLKRKNQFKQMLFLTKVTTFFNENIFVCKIIT